MAPHKSDKTPKSGHPKLKRLRKRLQYKKRDEDAHEFEDENEHVIENDLPDVNRDKHKRKKQNFLNRASPMKIVKLYKNQNDSHRYIITANGFSSFLNIKCSKLHPGLCNFLMDSFNTETCELEFPGRGSIPITDSLVHQVLGLPIGEIPVVHQTDEEAIAFVMATLGFGSSKQPKLCEVKAKLKQMELGCPVYFMMWVLYVVCSMLAPTTGVYISPRFYPAIKDPTKIKLMNWAHFVIDILIEAANEKDRKSPFKACMTFFMIAYVDSLQTRNIKVDKQGVRMCAWDNKAVAAAIFQDTKPDGSFGKLPLKKEFRENKVLMLNTPARIESFVRANMPQNCGEEEVIRYRDATQKMYADIDAVVAKFLKSVATISSSPQEAGVKNRRILTRRHQQVPVTDPSCSHWTGRRHQAHLSSSTEDDDTSDSDFLEDQDFHQSEPGKSTSLDDEQFDCIPNDDDDFMSAPNKRKTFHPAKNSRWCRQSQYAERVSSPQQVNPAVQKRKKHTRKEEQDQNILVTKARPIQLREPKKHFVQQTANEAEHADRMKNDQTLLKRKADKPVLKRAAQVIKKTRIAYHAHEHRSTAMDVHETVHVSTSHVATIVTENLQDKGGQHVGCKLPLKQNVAVDPLEQLKLYASDSQSSNDVERKVSGIEYTNLSSVPVTVPETTRGCLKRNDSGRSDQGIRASTSADAQIRIGSALRKSVSWADHTPSNAHNYLHDVKPPATPLAADNMSGQDMKEVSENKSAESAARTRPITRSMSPMKPMVPTKEATSPVTRSISSANPLLLLQQGISASSKRSSSANVTDSNKLKSPSRQSRLGKYEETTTPVCKGKSSIIEDSMSRKLEFDAEDSATRWEPGEAPSFDLGIDDPPQDEEAAYKIDPATGLLVITSSNEEEFYGPAEDYEILAAQMGKTYFSAAEKSEASSSGTTNRAIEPEQPSAPNEKELTPASKVTNNVTTCSHDPDSKTPVPLAHQKRILKPGKAQMSPFVTSDKPKLTNDTTKMYMEVCKHGSKTESKIKGEYLIDYGVQFAYLGDVTDSVKSEGWLSNSTCEIGLHVLAQEMIPQRKYVMPLVIADKMRDGCFRTKDVKKVFEFSDAHRLDHKEQIMFPVLQNLTSVKDLFIGHYYLINLNLKAERFEIMDSLRNGSDKLLKSDSSKIINSIKSIWASNYKQSKIQIQNFETVHISVPKQLTTYDCGYCMLKCIECWDGRKMRPFSTVQMPVFRLQCLKKWVEWGENKVLWEELLQLKQKTTDKVSGFQKK